MADFLIKTTGLCKHFEELKAVQDVNFEVSPGEILALLGPNGAGKTTTIRMLASILRPTQGQAWIGGYSVLEKPGEVRRRVGLLTEQHGLYTRMRSQDYLRFFGRAYGLAPEVLEPRIQALLSEFDLLSARSMRLGHYSRGMRQKLVLARSLLHNPEVLLLDEPTSAMDPASARAVRQSIVGLRSSQRAIVVCTHNLAEAEELADRIAIIRHGRIIANDRPHNLKQQMLGDPIMELRLFGDLNGAIQALRDQVKVIEHGPDWLRYRTPDPSKDNPAVVRAMQSANLSVVTLSEVGRTLEEVYLEVVGTADRADSEGLR